MSIVSDDLRVFSTDLGRTGVRVTRNVQKATEVTARKIKDDARKNARKSAGRRARGYAAKITYDMTYGLRGPGAEIGPETSGQGALGVLEDAPGRVRSGAHQDLARAAKSNVADYVRGLAMAASDLW
ncbi:hypothetical protein ACF1AJ_20455 [Leifsonia sp. NPDC014704]|uniref:hypothetical protein n=1 Tax=Leifsonia sp. NPDC014704 TaxID=3364123 RepID=UPI0036F4A52D